MKRKTVGGVLIPMLLIGIGLFFWCSRPGVFQLNAEGATFLPLKTASFEHPSADPQMVKGYLVAINTEDRTLDIIGHEPAEAKFRVKIQPATRLIYLHRTGGWLVKFEDLRPDFYVEASIDSTGTAREIVLRAPQKQPVFLGEVICQPSFPLAGLKVSPDGKRIALLGEGYDHGLSYLNEEGKTVIIGQTLSRSLSWSPDGQHLAFVKQEEVRGKDEKLCVFSFANGLVRVIKTTKSTPQQVNGFSYVAWSPDGRTIAYGDWTGLPYSEGYTQQIALISPDGGTEKPVATDFVDTSMLNWSPDGCYLLINEVLSPEMTDALIKQIEVATREVTDLTSLAKPGDLFPSYSPDGALIAFLRKDGVADTIWLMDRRGQCRRQVAREAGRIYGLCWVDASHIVYCNQDSRELIGVNLLTGQKRWLTSGLEPNVVGRTLYYLDRPANDGEQHIYKLKLEDF